MGSLSSAGVQGVRVPAPHSMPMRNACTSMRTVSAFASCHAKGSYVFGRTGGAVYG